MERVFYIDLSDATTIEELQDILTKELPTPDYYGRNLDAFYDVLGDVSKKWNIIFYNTTKAKKNLGKYFNALERLCADACSENENLQIRFYD